MSSQTFCLLWDNFASGVTAEVDSLLRLEELVDITLCCDGQSVKAHRMMLSVSSPYFRKLLRENPCQHPVFFLKDTRISDLRAVVEFIYKGVVNVAQEQLAGFMRTAEMLQLRGIAGTDNAPTTSARRRPGDSKPPAHAPVDAADPDSTRTPAAEPADAPAGTASAVGRAALDRQPSPRQKRRRVSAATEAPSGRAAADSASVSAGGGAADVNLEAVVLSDDDCTPGSSLGCAVNLEGNLDGVIPNFPARRSPGPAGTAGADGGDRRHASDDSSDQWILGLDDDHRSERTAHPNPSQLLVFDARDVLDESEYTPVPSTDGQNKPEDSYTLLHHPRFDSTLHEWSVRSRLYRQEPLHSWDWSSIMTTLFRFYDLRGLARVPVRFYHKMASSMVQQFPYLARHTGSGDPVEFVRKKIGNKFKNNRKLKSMQRRLRAAVGAELSGEHPGPASRSLLSKQRPLKKRRESAAADGDHHGGADTCSAAGGESGPEREPQVDGEHPQAAPQRAAPEQSLSDQGRAAAEGSGPMDE